MRKTLTVEEILNKNPGIDPEKLREFLAFQQLAGALPPHPGPASPKTPRRLVVGDPDNDDSRIVRLRYSR